MTSEYDNIKLPIFTENPLPHKYLSMDEYDAFINHDIQHSFDREAYQKEKALRRVNVLFTLDD
jgi:hypothetical protein